MERRPSRINRFPVRERAGRVEIDFSGISAEWRSRARTQTHVQTCHPFDVKFFSEFSERIFFPPKIKRESTRKRRAQRGACSRVLQGAAFS